MKQVILVIILLSLANGLFANPLDNHRADKKVQISIPFIIDPDRIRQGGDTIDDAFIIDSLPFTDTGTTVGYNNNYEQNCHWNIGQAPEVCYLFVSDQPAPC